MIPTIMRTTEEILRLVPTSLREGSLALGAGRARTMFSIVLPAARNGVITGIMLALARIAGETAPLLFTIGGNDVLSVRLTARPPFVHGLSDQIDSLPYRIYQDIMNGDPNLNHQAMVAALILVVLIFGMSLITRLATSNKLLEEK
jgi:phosphate transport system permease protein